MTSSDKPVILSQEISEEIEKRIIHTLRGIEDTLKEILEKGEISFNDVKNLLVILDPSFSLLSQRWVLEILYSLLIKGPLSFNELKKLTGASSRSLSTKLKSLSRLGLIRRTVISGPPLRTIYSLTETGKTTALLSLPLLYYIASRKLAI